MKSHEGVRGTFSTLYENLITALASLLLFISPWFYGLTRYRDQLAAQVAVFALAIAALPIIRLHGFPLKPRLSIDFRILSSLLISAIYTILSAVPFVSIFAFIQFFSVVVFYFLIRGLVTDEFRFHFFIRIIFLTGVFYSVYGIFQYYGYIPSKYWYQPGFLSSRLVNSGHFAGFLLMPVFSGIVLCLKSRDLRGWIFRMPLVLIMIFALVLTRGRTAWGAFGIGVLFLSFWSVLKNGRVSFPKIVLIFALLCIGYFSLNKFGAFTLITKRIDELVHVGGERNFYNLFFRFELWEGCLRAIWARPWGWGIGAFSTIFPLFRVNDDRYFIDYAHNEVLQISVDFGIPGLVLCGLFLFVYFRKVLSCLRDKAADRMTKVSLLCFGAAFLGLLITSLTDFPLRIYSNTLFFAVLLSLNGFLFKSASTISEDVDAWDLKMKKRGKIAAFLNFVILFAALLAAGRHLCAQMVYAQGVTLEGNYGLRQAAEKYIAAERLVPYCYEYAFSLGGVYRKMSALSFDKEERRTVREKGIRAYERALKLNPYSSEAHYYLALSLEESDLSEAAAAEFEKAIYFSPKKGFYPLEYGYFSLRHQMIERAANAFERFKGLKFREYPGGDCCEVIRKCSEQISDYELLKRIAADQFTAFYCLGAVMAEKGQWDAAQIEFEKYLDFGRSNYELSYYHDHFRAQIASLYVSKGRIRDALNLYEKDLQLNPDDSIAIAKITELKNKLIT